ncbi:hypothetical protein [Methylosinus sp. RM1]|uniref:hypothetical protein n=1 Tax=Methylosinus sp. RM1 TaxID=2583817 RepID=UPI00140AA5E4|nr:hypothetical protein [Methylosinus sp. RM1]
MFNEGSPLDNGAIELLATLCNKAIAEHGDNVVAVEKYVASHIGRMAPHDRQTFMTHIDVILKAALASYKSSATH